MQSYRLAKQRSIGQVQEEQSHPSSIQSQAAITFQKVEEDIQPVRAHFHGGRETHPNKLGLRAIGNKEMEKLKRNEKRVVSIAMGKLVS